MEPKRHVPGLADLTDVEAQALGLMVARVSQALKASEKAEHVYACARLRETLERVLSR